VLQTRSVEMAMNYHVRTQVLSSFSDAEEHYWWKRRSCGKKTVTGIAYSRGRAYHAHVGGEHPRVSAAIFGSARGCQHQRRHDCAERHRRRQETDVTFTVPRAIWTMA